MALCYVCHMSNSLSKGIKKAVGITASTAVIALSVGELGEAVMEGDVAPFSLVELALNGADLYCAITEGSPSHQWLESLPLRVELLCFLVYLILLYVRVFSRFL